MRDILLLAGITFSVITPLFAFSKMYKRIIGCQKRKIYAQIVSFIFSMPTLIAALSVLSILDSDYSNENNAALCGQIMFIVIIVGMYFFIYFLHSKKEYIVCVDSDQASLSPSVEEQFGSRKNFLIGYNDADNILTIRKIEVIAVSQDCFDAYCHLRKAKRTFLIKNVLDSITDVQTCLSIDKWEWFESIGGHKPYSIGVSNKSSDLRVINDEVNSLPDNKSEACSESDLASDKSFLVGSEILFTGFKSDMRLCLEDSARACGMIVRTKVTKNLSYLVCGPKDAPAKRLEAINVGASIVYGEDEFRDLVTG